MGRREGGNGTLRQAVSARLDRRPLLVCHGHSYLSYWTPLISGYRVECHARGGFLTAATRDVVLAMPSPPRRAMVVVEVGLNDARRYGSDPEALRAFTADLGEIRRHLGARGAPVMALLDPPIRDWQRYEPSDRGSAEALDLYRAAMDASGPTIDLAIGWDLDSMIGEDGVHPSLAGDRHIAAAVMAGVRSQDRPMVRRAEAGRPGASGVR